MRPDQRTTMRGLEGHEVNIALEDGSRIDAAALVSAGGGGGAVWVFCSGTDVFIPASDVRDVWEASCPGRDLP